MGAAVACDLPEPAEIANHEAKMRDAEIKSASRSFRALGSSCSIEVWVESDQDEAEKLITSSVTLLDALERRWSRFLPGSDLSRLNRSPGGLVAVDRVTVELITAAIAAWELTNGRFDPTVGQAVIDAGYDKSFEGISTPYESANKERLFGAPAPGCAGIEIDAAFGAVTLPYGTKLDFGGIGKGRSADIVASFLIAAGARGVCVSLGGDIRVMGEPFVGDLWMVGVGDPMRPGVPFQTLAISGAGGAGGAVATSSVTRRRWGTPEGVSHHIIDPDTGKPSTSSVIAATVVGADAMWAEVYAKAALIAGPEEGRRIITDAGLSGLLIMDPICEDGSYNGKVNFVTAGNIDQYMVAS